MMNNYELLKVNVYDDTYIIKDAHNKLIKEYKNSDLKEKQNIEKFTAINDAYKVLNNKKTRLEYDRQLYNDYLDLNYKTDNIVNIAYLYYRNDEKKEAINLLLNINKHHKSYFDSVILLSRIYKDNEIIDNNINKNKYNNSEKILLNLYHEYKDNDNLYKAIILIELIDLYCLINDINKVNLYMNEINSIYLSDKKELKYIENRKKELKKKHKDIEKSNDKNNYDDKSNIEVTKSDNDKIEIKEIIKDFINIVNFEIDNGFTEKIKINRKLERFRNDLVKKLDEILNTNNKNNQIKYLEESLKLIDNALKDIGEEIVALKNIKEKFEKIKL